MKAMKGGKDEYGGEGEKREREVERKKLKGNRNGWRVKGGEGRKTGRWPKEYETCRRETQNSQ